jgi:hypothetical protein
MATNLIDLRQASRAVPGDLSGLQAYLAPLIGEPFRFARVSYGDEVTLHFGDLHPARSPKLPKHMYGTYILSLRGSAWTLKSGSEPLVLTAGILSQPIAPSIGKPLAKEELESKQFIKAESMVLAALPFLVKPVNGYGLQLRMSDASTLFVVPTLEEPDTPNDERLPELADWELLSPHGLLRVGPGLKWSVELSAAHAADENGSVSAQPS